MYVVFVRLTPSDAAVVGDKISASHDVVSALLQDVLSDSAAQRDSVLNRYFGTATDYLHITYGPHSRTPGRLSTQASWLSSSKSDIVEVTSDKLAASAVLDADSVVAVMDPIRLLDAPIYRANDNEVIKLIAAGPAHYVINGMVPPHMTEEEVQARLEEQLAKFHPRAGEYDITFVNADAALNAHEALALALEDSPHPEIPGRQTPFNIFQEGMMLSNINTLQKELSATVPVDPQLETAARIASEALAYTGEVLASDRHVLQHAQDTVAELRREVRNGAARAKRLSVVARGIDSGVVEGSVDQSVATTKQGLKQLFDGRLSWLGLIARLRVDDVGAEVGSYISRHFGRDIEQQLTYEAGQLAQLQASLGDAADSTARQLTKAGGEAAGHPFSSPLLINHLSSLSLSIPRVSPSTLLQPVTSRRSQMLGTMVPKLQISAQRTLLSTYALSLAGVSASWCAYVQPLELISSSTAIGTGLLSLVSGVALGQQIWAKAQKRWWKDWDRVTNMLKDDLASNYDRTVDNLVVAKPDIAADGLTELIDKRRERLDELALETHSLGERVEQQAPQVPKRSD